MSDYLDRLDGLTVDLNLPGSYSHAIDPAGVSVAGGTTSDRPSVDTSLASEIIASVGSAAPIAQAVALDPNAPVTLKQLVNAFQVFTPSTPAVTQGSTTTEFKLAGAVCTFLSVASVLFVALSANGVFHLSPEVTAAVPAVASAVIGWVTTNYVNSRTAVKLANSNPPKA